MITCRHCGTVCWLHPPITPPIIPATDLEQRILKLLLDAPVLSSGDLANSLSMRRDMVKKYLGRLKEKGLLVREGPTRTGRWRVTDTDKSSLYNKS